MISSVERSIAKAALCRWTVDPARSHLEFSVSEFGRRLLSGSFTRFSGEVLTDDTDYRHTVLGLDVDAGSIDTGSPLRDLRLVSDRCLDARLFQTIRFRSRAITPRSRCRLIVEGDLTFRSATRRIMLDLIRVGRPADSRPERERFRAFGIISACDFETEAEGRKPRSASLGRVASVVMDAELVRASVLSGGLPGGDPPLRLAGDAF